MANSAILTFRVDGQLEALLDAFMAQAAAKGAKVSRHVAARALLASALNIPHKRAVAMEVLLGSYRVQKSIAGGLSEIIHANVPTLLAQAFPELEELQVSREEPERVAGS